MVSTQTNRVLLRALETRDPSIPWKLADRAGGLLALIRVDGNEWGEIGWVSERLAIADTEAAARVLVTHVQERCGVISAAWFR